MCRYVCRFMYRYICHQICRAGKGALELLPLGGETAAEAMALFMISLCPMRRKGRLYLVVVVLDMMADFSFERAARLPRGSADDDEVSTLFFNKVTHTPVTAVCFMSVAWMLCACQTSMLPRVLHV